MQWATVKNGKHRGKFVEGDEFPVHWQELESFSDKLEEIAPVDVTEAAERLMLRFCLCASDVSGTGKDGRIVQDDVKAILTPAQLAELEENGSTEQ